MQTTHYRKQTPGDGKVSFPGLECWNPVTGVASIAANIDKTRVLCRISLETMKDRFGVRGDDPMGCLLQHRTAIQEAAVMLINSKRYEEDGSVLIGARDLR